MTPPTTPPTRATAPYGARDPNRRPTAPTAGHAGVLVAAIAIAAALIIGSTAAGGTGLIALLVPLLGCFALVVPVAVVVTTWVGARRRARVLLALAGIACLLLLAFAATRVATLAPLLLSA
jgi:hypothetical protein